MGRGRSRRDDSGRSREGHSLILQRLPLGSIDAAEDVDESAARLLRQRRAGEKREVGIFRAAQMKGC